MIGRCCTDFLYPKGLNLSYSLKCHNIQECLGLNDVMLEILNEEGKVEFRVLVIGLIVMLD